jgi:hypothetical protein
MLSQSLHLKVFVRVDAFEKYPVAEIEYVTVIRPNAVSAYSLCVDRLLLRRSRSPGRMKLPGSRFSVSVQPVAQHLNYFQPSP